MSKSCPVIDGRVTYRSFVAELESGDELAIGETVEGISRFVNREGEEKVLISMTNGQLSLMKADSTLLVFER